MLQLNYFCLLGAGNIKVSVKLTICGDHQTADRKAGAVTENRNICMLIVTLFFLQDSKHKVKMLFLSHSVVEVDV